MIVRRLICIDTVRPNSYSILQPSLRFSQQDPVRQLAVPCISRFSTSSPFSHKVHIAISTEQHFEDAGQRSLFLESTVTGAGFLGPPLATLFSFRQYNADYCDGVYRHMPRLPCFCKFAECGGTVVDSRTFDRHKRNDLSKHVRDAIATATMACKSQDDAIAEHLSSLSLSCNHPTNSTAPLHQFTTSSSRFYGKSTQQKLVEKLLRQLRDIETLLEDLIISVDVKLGGIGIGTPGAANDIFPLLSSISMARTIRTQLLGITSRTASVQEAKSSLLVRLEEVVTKLEAANHFWNTQAKNLPLREELPSDTTFSTGKSRFEIKTKRSLLTSSSRAT